MCKGVKPFFAEVNTCSKEKILKCKVDKADGDKDARMCVKKDCNA